MQSAYIKNTNKKVFAFNADDLQDQKFVCTNCGNIMFLRNGLVRVPHFYHSPDSSCLYDKNESEQHVKTKNNMFDVLKSRYDGKSPIIDMEYTGIAGCRPDVFINGKKNKIAIEILSVPTDVRDIIERTEIYFKAQIGVIWVLPFEVDRMISDDPDELYKRFKMKEHEKILYFMNNKKLIFWNNKLRSFTIAEFSRAYGNDTEFYSKDQGSMVYFSGKTLKSTFEIEQLIHKKYPEDLERWYSSKRFDMQGYRYQLPKSILWKYKPPVKNK